MKKRLAAMILAVGLGLFGLVGCSGGGGNGASSDILEDENKSFVQIYNEDGQIIAYGEPKALSHNSDGFSMNVSMGLVSFNNIPESQVRYGGLGDGVSVKLIVPDGAVDEDGNTIDKIVEEGIPKVFAYDTRKNLWAFHFGGGYWIDDVPTDWIIWLNGRPTL